MAHPTSHATTHTALPELWSSGFKPPQVARDRAFGDLKTELRELAVDPGSSPAVLCGHPLHQVADLAVEGCVDPVDAPDLESHFQYIEEPA
jgi:hypothetical protein